MAGVFGAFDRLSSLTEEEAAALAEQMENQRNSELNSLSRSLAAARAKRGISLGPIGTQKNSFNGPFGAVPNASALGVVNGAAVNPPTELDDLQGVQERGFSKASATATPPGIGPRSLSEIEQSLAEIDARAQASAAAYENALSGAHTERALSAIGMTPDLSVEAAEANKAAALNETVEGLPSIESALADLEASLNDTANVNAALDSIGSVPAALGTVDAISAVGPVGFDAAIDMANTEAALGQTEANNIGALEALAEVNAQVEADEAARAAVAQAAISAPVAGLPTIESALASYEAAEQAAKAEAAQIAGLTNAVSSISMAPTAPSVEAPPAPKGFDLSDFAASRQAALQSSYEQANSLAQSQALADEASGNKGTAPASRGLVGGLGFASLDDEGMTGVGLGPSGLGNTGPSRTGNFGATGLAASVPSTALSYDDVSFSGPGSFGNMSSGLTDGVQGLPSGMDVGLTSQSNTVGGLMGDATTSVGASSNPAAGFGLGQTAAETAAPAFDTASFSNNSFGGNAATQAAIDAAMESLESQTSTIGPGSMQTGSPAPAAPAPAAMNSFGFTGSNPNVAATLGPATVAGVPVSTVQNLGPLSTTQFATATPPAATTRTTQTAPVSVQQRTTRTTPATVPGLTGFSQATAANYSGVPGVSSIGAIDAGFGFSGTGQAYDSFGSAIDGAQFGDGTPVQGAFGDSRAGPAGAFGDSNGNGDVGGCYIATDAVENGAFSAMDKAKAEIWCQKHLHAHWAGETVRLGYQALSSKAVSQGRAKRHYEEFQRFIKYGRGLDKTLKGAATFYFRLAQFFAVGLIERIKQ